MPLSELCVIYVYIYICLVIGSAVSLGKIRFIEFYEVDAAE